MLKAWKYLDSKILTTKESGIEAKVINSRFLKPLNEEEILKEIIGVKKIITIEDGTLINGLGEKIEKILFENNVKTEFQKFGYPDEFVKHGTVSEIEKKYGLDVESIVECLMDQKKNIGMMKTSF